MSGTFNFQCSVINTEQDSKLLFSIIVNNTVLVESTVIKSLTTFSLDIPDSGTQEIRLVMSGKQPTDTTFDSSGNFVKNPMIEIRSIVIESCDCQRWVSENSKYTHNFNDGNADTIVDSFDTCMGCNGSVSFEIVTPVYVWLLDTI